jgi:hypothetical protein
MVESLSIRAVVFRDGEVWIAQCLEYGLCTSAKDRRELTRKLASQLRLQMVLDLARGKQPFQDLPRAPQRFWEMYSGSTPDEQVQIRGPWLGNLLRIWRGRSQVLANLSLATA